MASTFFSNVAVERTNGPNERSTAGGVTADSVCLSPLFRAVFINPTFDTGGGREMHRWREEGCYYGELVSFSKI